MRDILIVILVFSFFIIGGCGYLKEIAPKTGGPIPPGSSQILGQTGVAGPPSSIGRGVGLSFLNGQPRSTIYLGEEGGFDIGVKLVNYASNDVSGTLTITDDATGDAEAIPPVDVNSYFSLDGAISEDPRLPPNLDEEEIDVGSFYYPNTEDALDFVSITAELRYDYGYDSSAQICIKDEETRLQPGECRSTENDLVQNDNSPIVIRSITKEINRIGESVNLILTLELSDQGSRDAASSGQEAYIDTERRVMDVPSVILGNTPLRCNPSNGVSFRFEQDLRFGESPKIRCFMRMIHLERNKGIPLPLKVRYSYPYYHKIVYPIKLKESEMRGF